MYGCRKRCILRIAPASMQPSPSKPRFVSTVLHKTLPSTKMTLTWTKYPRSWANIHNVGNRAQIEVTIENLWL